MIGAELNKVCRDLPDSVKMLVCFINQKRRWHGFVRFDSSCVISDDGISTEVFLTMNIQKLF